MTAPHYDSANVDDEMSGMTAAQQRLFIVTKLSNPWWRLNNLYKIENEKGELVTFRLRPAQRALFESMHYPLVCVRDSSPITETIKNVVYPIYNWASLERLPLTGAF